MSYLYIALGVIAAASWVPILFFFFNNFKTRNNPVSLAIGTLVSLIILISGPATYWLISKTADMQWVLIFVNLLSIAVCIHFYVAIMWSQKRYLDARDDG